MCGSEAASLSLGSTSASSYRPAGTGTGRTEAVQLASPRGRAWHGMASSLSWCSLHADCLQGTPCSQQARGGTVDEAPPQPTSVGSRMWPPMAIWQLSHYLNKTQPIFRQNAPSFPFSHLSRVQDVPAHGNLVRAIQHAGRMRPTRLHHACASAGRGQERGRQVESCSQRRTVGMGQPLASSCVPVALTGTH